MDKCIHDIPLDEPCSTCAWAAKQRKQEGKLHMVKVTREHELAAALLWLRNHYDIDDQNMDIKSEVLKRVDKVLEDGPELSIEHQVAFRAKYPSDKP
jgi:hypothetical protein